MAVNDPPRTVAKIHRNVRKETPQNALELQPPKNSKDRKNVRYGNAQNGRTGMRTGPFRHCGDTTE